MDQILILNGSPRAPWSNSRQYAQIFARYCTRPTRYLPVRRDNHRELCCALGECADVVLAFPLYADAIPSTLLNFFKTLESHPPRRRPRMSVLINCGFLEPEQNDVAVDMVRLFCRQQGYPFGSLLRIGGGEAILATPMKWLVVRKLQRLATSVCQCGTRTCGSPCPWPRGCSSGPPLVTGRLWAGAMASPRRRWPPWTLRGSPNERAWQLAAANTFPWALDIPDIDSETGLMHNLLLGASTLPEGEGEDV